MSAVTILTHALTDHDREAMVQLRALTAAGKGGLHGVPARSAFDDISAHTPAPEGVGYRPAIVGGLKGWWCEPENATPDGVILHLHGGWFVWGSAEAYRHIVGHLALAAKARAFVPDYRLAPEHPFPAATDDVRACLAGLIQLGHSRIAITGDSAGGALALGLASDAAVERDRVAAVVALSPVTDLTLSGESWSTRAEADPFFTRGQVEGLVALYLNGQAADVPRASPLFGDQSGMPPIRIHVGDAEVLRDDAVRYGERAAAAGADVEVHVWEGMPHVFTSSTGVFDAADTATRMVGAFIAEHLSG